MNLSIPARLTTTWDFLFTRNERVPDRNRTRHPVQLVVVGQPKRNGRIVRLIREDVVICSEVFVCGIGRRGQKQSGVFKNVCGNPTSDSSA